MTRDNLWQRLRALKGRTLRTVTGRGVFEVLRVADDAVVERRLAWPTVDD
jgi:hypothetical protein